MMYIGQTSYMGHMSCITHDVYQADKLYGAHELYYTLCISGKQAIQGHMSCITHDVYQADKLYGAHELYYT